MFNFYLSYKYLYWRRRPTGFPAPTPEGIERIFIQTPGGRIEILCAQPVNPLSKTPVVFAHGGMGGAWVWIPYMRYLAARGITSYAVSTRGHGESWHPSFLRMVWGVTKRDLGDDLVAGIKAVEEREGSHVVLVGHSSGGGLSQFILSEGDVQVKGLALLGAVPGNGSFHVYRNWVGFDPWFAVRMFFHGWHSHSPLSHPYLLRRVFFSQDYAEDKLLEFQSRMNRYESLLWPFGMMLPFVNGKKLLQSILGWDTGSTSRSRILIMAGTEDKMMTRDVQTESARFYRSMFSELVKEKKIEAEDERVQTTQGDRGLDNAGQGVQVAWVPGAGHHLQNDTTWEVGADKLLQFLLQL
ncbi:Alpha/Beta hydrolase protein [Camillea tinctor]|nr:Alpha/Beta hydrolase protein [Camillea tinctor]